MVLLERVGKFDASAGLTSHVTVANFFFALFYNTLINAAFKCYLKALSFLLLEYYIL